MHTRKHPQTREYFFFSLASVLIGVTWFFFKLNARTEKNEKSIKSLIDTIKRRNKIIDEHIHYIESNQVDLSTEIGSIRPRLNKIEKDIDSLKSD